MSEFFGTWVAVERWMSLSDDKDAIPFEWKFDSQYELTIKPMADDEIDASPLPGTVICTVKMMLIDKWGKRRELPDSSPGYMFANGDIWLGPIGSAFHLTTQFSRGRVELDLKTGGGTQGALRFVFEKRR